MPKPSRSHARRSRFRGYEPGPTKGPNLNWYVPNRALRERARRIVRDYAYDEGIPVSEALYVLILRGSK